MKLAVVVGTRPEIIRLAPLVFELQRRRVPFRFIHAGQHYDFRMSGIFLRELGLPKPDHHLRFRAKTHATQLAAMLPPLERIFQEGSFDGIVAQGDANSTLAATLAAVKVGIPAVHVEAGNRHYAMNHVEELNRRIVDHMSSLLFAQSTEVRRCALLENIPSERVHVVGNTVIDACLLFGKDAHRRGRLYRRSPSRDHILVTLHRAETVDDRGRLRGFVRALRGIAGSRPVVFPIHPRTHKRLRQFGLTQAVSQVEDLTLTEPLGYFDFLAYLRSARLLVTDSGGALKESTAFHIPAVVFTDIWPDTEGRGVFWDLSGYRPENLVVMARTLSSPARRRRLRSLRCPFGDGHASRRIVSIIQRAHRRGELTIPVDFGRVPPGSPRRTAREE